MTSEIIYSLQVDNIHVHNASPSNPLCNQYAAENVVKYLTCHQAQVHKHML